MEKTYQKRRKNQFIITAIVVGRSSLTSKQRIDCSVRPRKKNRPRTRAKLGNIQRYLGKTFFQRSYRMPEEKVEQLINLLTPYFPSKQRVGPNGSIPIDLEVCIALRYFAGGSPLDFIGKYGVSHTSVFKAIWRVVYAINKCEALRINFPSDHAEQRRIASVFKEKSQVGFENCVGCIDGLLICTEKPTEKEAHRVKTGSKAFFCGRKGKFGFNMQAVCDANGKFLAVWILNPASSSDFISFIRSKLFSKLTTPGFLAEGLVLFGDNAYVSTNYMVTPYKNVRAGTKDDYNFFHSQLRINIERAFGMLVKKWAILQKPLSCQMGIVKQLALTMAMCSLHNFCYDDPPEETFVENSEPAPATFQSGPATGENIDVVEEPRIILDGGEHFDDVLEEEIASEQRSLIRLQMRKKVEESGLHRAVISLQNRNN